MTAELERVLKEKCAIDPRLELLHAQWVYDKRLLSQALQTVGNIFPHYSLHDASHSSSILVQITRVLGDRIRDLSATDLWLLLESAYWHDIGMVVDDATLRKWWDSPDFRAHIAALAESSDEVLASAARLLKDRKVRCDSHDLDIKNAVTLIAAEYARTRHADRSGELVDQPLTIGLQTPRTLIPSRLFRWLGQIAVSHGRSDTFVNDLPQTESGMGTDDCHPRFVARMLRLGDLLDLDNGRFCPVLLSMVGKLPATSQAHIGKHASIQHFCVSPEKVEVTAVCESDAARLGHSLSASGNEAREGDPYASYEAIATWLAWLEKELGYLASHWNDIAPPNFGGAPSIGQIGAQLKDYICLKEGERPRFRVDETAFLALVRSNSLYEDKHAWLRELLANAEDATRIRAFVENRHQLSELAEPGVKDPIKALSEALKRYPISVDLQSVKDRGNQVHVSIRDNGTGISLKDLEYILTIGSSRKNPIRRRIVDEMPGILQPTGAFGIGLQSVFMVTNEIVIDTLHFQSRDRLSIMIRRKSSAAAFNKGHASVVQPTGRDIATLVYVRKPSQGEGLSEPGTRIQFFITSEAASNGYVGAANSMTNSGVEQGIQPSLTIADKPLPTSRGKGPSLTSSTAEHIDPASRFDPILTEEPGLEVEVLKNLVEDLATRLATPVILNSEPLRNDQFSEEGSFFSHAEQCSVLFRACKLSDNRVSLRYRGAEVKNHNLANMGLLDVVVDLHFGGANEILTASRDALTPYGNQFVQEKVINALADVFPRYLKRLETQASRKPRSSKTTHKSYITNLISDAKESFAQASLYAKVYLPDLRGFALSQRWEDVPIAYEKAKLVSLKRVLSNEVFDICVSRNSRLDMGRATTIPQFTLLPDFPSWVRDVLLTLERGSQLIEWRPEVMRYRFGMADAASRESSAFPLMLLGWSLWSQRRVGYFRPTFPMPSRFEKLALNFRELPQWALEDRLLVRRQMVSPLEFRIDVNVASLTFNTDHLPFYIDWICNKSRKSTDGSTTELRQAVIEEVREFCQALTRVDLKVFWQDGNEDPVGFNVQTIDRIFAKIN